MKDMKDKMGRALVKKGAAGKAMMGMKKGIKKMAFGGMSGGTFGGMKQRAEPTREPRERAMQPARPVSLSRYKKGGSVGSFRKAADGVASKGKTKGKMVKMNKGGYC